MNLRAEFPRHRGYSRLQDEFFLSRLPREQKGRYWFRERGLDADPGTIVLFQCQNQIVASAVLRRTKRFSEPDEGYAGWLQFEPRSIRVFDPVDSTTVGKIWREFTGFSHVRWELNGAGYAALERQLTNVRPMSIAEKILAAAIRIAGPEGRNVFSRDDIRQALGVESKRWAASYSPTFQGMRRDQPGGAPLVGQKYRNVFRRVSPGQHALTKYGLQFLDSYWAADGAVAAELAATEDQLEDEDYFSPSNLCDERERQLRAVVARRGQCRFRRKLIIAYAGKCAVTRCDAQPALEAAHILPYTGVGSHHASNGLLLRSDIHTLFDLDLLGINPTTGSVVLARSLRRTRYEKLNGKIIVQPVRPAARPNATALEERWKWFIQKSR